MTLHILPPPSDPYEDAVDCAIATCNGDLRGALKALIIANELLDRDLKKALAGPVDRSSRPGGGSTMAIGQDGPWTVRDIGHQVHDHKISTRYRRAAGIVVLPDRAIMAISGPIFSIARPCFGQTGVKCGQ